MSLLSVPKPFARLHFRIPAIRLIYWIQFSIQGQINRWKFITSESIIYNAAHLVSNFPLNTFTLCNGDDRNVVFLLFLLLLILLLLVMEYIL